MPSAQSVIMKARKGAPIISMRPRYLQAASSWCSCSFLLPGTISLLALRPRLRNIKLAYRRSYIRPPPHSRRTPIAWVMRPPVARCDPAIFVVDVAIFGRRWHSRYPLRRGHSRLSRAQTDKQGSGHADFYRTAVGTGRGGKNDIWYLF